MVIFQGSGAAWRDYTNFCTADMLTKSLLSQKFIDFRDMVIGEDALQNHFFSKLKATHINAIIPQKA